MATERSYLSQTYPESIRNLHLEVSGERAIGNAQQEASKGNGHIKFSDLYQGVVHELGQPIVNSVLNSSGVSPFRFQSILEEIIFFEDRNRSAKEREGLSDCANRVLNHAGSRSESRGKHSQRINARDLLHGIVLVAIEEANIVDIEQI